MALTTNLISYWKLDESSGDASDSKGANTLFNQGTTSFTTGKINNGITNNGTSGKYFKTTDINTCDISGDFSISFWYKSAATPGATQGLFLKNDILRVYYQSGPKLTVKAGNYKDYSTTLTSGTWYHLVITVSGTTQTLYKNASSVGTGTASARTNGDQPFQVGIDNDGVFNGVIDEVGFWTRALSSGEVTTLYNSGSGIQYPFGETISSVTHNLGTLGVGS